MYIYINMNVCKYIQSDVKEVIEDIFQKVSSTKVSMKNNVPQIAGIGACIIIIIIII
jgi:hypothetical protein